MKTPPIYPRLANNEICSINGERYRAEFWQGNRRYYDFVYIGENGKENFSRDEKTVSEAILDKKVVRISQG